MHAIAIDGPAGAGKSTIAKRVSSQLEFIYIDTGAMYRAMAIHMLNEGISPENGEGIDAACEHANIEITFLNGEQQVILNGKNITGELRAERVGDMASKTSVRGKVRRRLVELQQQIADKNNVVMDGRDIGTVVLPNAELKIYLTASSAVRAKRRYNELLAKGESGDLAEIQKDIEERDHRDMTREESPLKKAEDAVELDSSDMTIEEVTEKIIALYQSRQ